MAEPARSATGERKDAQPVARDGGGRTGRRVSIATTLCVAVAAAVLATAATAFAYTEQNREAALEEEIDTLTLQLAAASQELDDCEASRQSTSAAVTELSAARDDMDRALAAFDQGVTVDVTKAAIAAANARYSSALDALTAIPDCGG